MVDGYEGLGLMDCVAEDRGTASWFGHKLVACPWLAELLEVIQVLVVTSCSRLIDFEFSCFNVEVGGILSRLMSRPVAIFRQLHRAIVGSYIAPKLPMSVTSTPSSSSSASVTSFCPIFTYRSFIRRFCERSSLASRPSLSLGRLGVLPRLRLRGGFDASPKHGS